MAKKPENVFRDSIHKYMTENNPYHMKNNNGFVGGVADDWYSGNADDLWVEYKFIVLPKRGTTMIIPGLSKLQLEWCTNRYTEGRNIIIITGCKEGGVVFERPHEWIQGVTRKTFAEQMLTRKELATYIKRRVTVHDTLLDKSTS